MDRLVEVHRCDQAEAVVVKSLFESQEIPTLLRSRLAHSVHPFSVGAQGEYREPGGRTSRYPEKIAEHALIRQSVRIDQQSHIIAAPQHLQHGLDRLVFIYCAVAG